jgi:predicted nuclease of predicted toxin-antitoxin system
MKLYLDDNLAGKGLEAHLVKAGHSVVRSHQAGLLGASDARHLAHAIRIGLVALTNDWKDFEDLHYLILAAVGRHPGVITVRYDSDPSRDMKPTAIVKALGKLESSGIPLANELVMLNHWR